MAARDRQPPQPQPAGPAPRSSAPGSAGAAPDLGNLLHLQRMAGNRAVTAVVQRATDPGDAGAPDPAGSPQAPDTSAPAVPSTPEAVVAPVPPVELVEVGQRLEQLRGLELLMDQRDQTARSDYGPLVEPDDPNAVLKRFDEQIRVRAEQLGLRPPDAVDFFNDLVAGADRPGATQLRTMARTKLQQEMSSLKAQFIAGFGQQLAPMTSYVLSVNDQVADREIRRYRGGTDPQLLKTGARALLPLEAAVREAGRRVAGHQGLPGSTARSREYEEAIERLVDQRRVYGASTPVLLNEDLSLEAVVNARDDELVGLLEGPLAQVKRDIADSRRNLRTGALDPWSLGPVVQQTERLLGMEPGGYASRQLHGYMEAQALGKVVDQIAIGAIGMVAGILAAGATGGASVVGAAGQFLAGATAAGISFAQLGTSIQAFEVQSAAAGSAVSSAGAIAAERPNLLWLAFDIAGAVADAGAALQAFRTLAAALDAGHHLEDLTAIVRQEVAKLTSSLVPPHNEGSLNALLLGAIKANGPKGAAAKGLAAELVKPDSLRAAAILANDGAACRAALAEGERWEHLVEQLMAAGPRGEEVASGLARHRDSVIEMVYKQTGARPLEGASTKAVSDIDLNTSGVTSGAKVLEAEKLMEGLAGKQWSEMYRMAFYTDATRLVGYRQVLLGMEPGRLAAFRAKVLTKLTERSKILNEAKSLHHAGGDVASVARVRQRCGALGIDLGAVEKEAARLSAPGAERAALFVENDRLAGQLAAPGTSAIEKEDLALRITENQMEANFLSKEAYIGPGALLGVLGEKAVGLDAHQLVHSNLEMIEHIIHEAGGVAEAVRGYETYKYFNRIIETLKGNGLATSRLEAFGNIAEYVYRTNRKAHAAVGGVVDAAVTKEMTRFRAATAEELAGVADHAGLPRTGTTPSGLHVEVYSEGGVVKGRVASGFYTGPADVGAAAGNLSDDTLRSMFASVHDEVVKQLPKLEAQGRADLAIEQTMRSTGRDAPALLAQAQAGGAAAKNPSLVEQLKQYIAVRRGPGMGPTAGLDRNVASWLREMQMDFRSYWQGLFGGPMLPVNHYSLHPDLIGANAQYLRQIEATPGREVGLFVNRITDEHAVIQGAGTWGMGGDYVKGPGPSVIPGTSGRDWIALEHYHPEKNYAVQMPSGELRNGKASGDFARLLYDQGASTKGIVRAFETGVAIGVTERVSSRIRYRDPLTGRYYFTTFGYDPGNNVNVGRFFVETDTLLGGRVTYSFSNMDEYEVIVQRLAERYKSDRQSQFLNR